MSERQQTGARRITYPQIDQYYRNERERKAARDIMAAGLLGRAVFFIGAVVVIPYKLLSADSVDLSATLFSIVIMLLIAWIVVYLPSIGMRRLGSRASVRASVVVALMGSIPMAASIVGAWYTMRCIIAAVALRNYRPVDEAATSAGVSDSDMTVPTKRKLPAKVVLRRLSWIMGSIVACMLAMMASIFLYNTSEDGSLAKRLADLAGSLLLLTTVAIAIWSAALAFRAGKGQRLAPILLGTIAILIWPMAAAVAVVVNRGDTPVQAEVQQQPSKYDVGPADPQELLELVNEERKRVGVPPLQYDHNVHMSAQLKSNDMLARNYKQHNLPGTNYTLTQEMYEWVSKSCVRSSENFYWAGFPATSRDAFNWWMSSKAHREAIQDAKYTKTGFGISVGGEENTFAVQHFCITN